jgi:putative hydrolase of the HAD superfamily
MKISAVCFDLGKVLIDFDKTAMVARMAEQSKLTSEEIGELLRHDRASLDYECGQISTPKFFAHLKKLIKFQGTTDELMACYNEIFTPMPDHIALAALLAPHYPLAIISNTNDAHIVYAEATYSFFTLFHARIYSHQVKAMKPQPVIYQAALKALGGIDPLEALFIDDLEANILGAVELGWQTIHLRPGIDLREALASYDLMGLDVGGVGPTPVEDRAPAPNTSLMQGFKATPMGGAPARKPFPGK